MQLHFDTKNTGYMYVCECVHVCVHFIILFVSVLKKWRIKNWKSLQITDFINV